MKLVLVSHPSLLAVSMLVAGSLVGLGGFSVAHAGPIEVFYSAEWDRSTPDAIVAPYFFGGAGLFISRDSGETFNLMCMSEANPKLLQYGISGPKVLLNNGSIYIATFAGLWKGDKDGCNFAPQPELMQFVDHLASDPLDPKRVYAVTSVASPAMNGIYMSDGSTPFTAFGAQEVMFINTIHVAKNSMARRFYETGVLSDLVTNKVTYSVRVSDDDAATFTSTVIDLSMFGSVDGASFSILAIDPQNPDRVIARIDRDNDTGMKDSVLESIDAGKTFRNVIDLGDFRAVAFTPDSKLYIGDNNQNERKLYVVNEAGGDATTIGSGWKVGCLSWDDNKQRMLGCSDYRFGTVDLKSGELQDTFDMRCAGSFVECPGASVSAADACRSQLTAAYCGPAHYPMAPVCAPYNGGQTPTLANAGYMCAGDIVTDPNVPGPTGSAPNGPPPTDALGSTSGTSGGDAGGSLDSKAGDGAAIGTAGIGAAGSASSMQKPSAGCGCALANAHASRASATWLVGVIAALGLRAQRRRRSGR